MKIRVILLILIVSAAAIVATYELSNHRPAATPLAAQTQPEKPAGIQVKGLKTALATVGEGWDTLTLTGKISVPSDKLVQISPRIEGKVTAAYPKVGDAVHQGQVLAVVSSVELAEARAQYRLALSKLDAAKKELARELQVVELGANSVRPLEEARAQSLDAQGALADAKSELVQARSEMAKVESELAQCKSRLDRARELYADQIVSRQDVETAEAEFRIDTAAVDAAKSKVSQAESRIEKAKSSADIARQYVAREERVYKGKVVDARAVQSVKSAVASAKTEVTAAEDRIRVLGADPNASGEGVAVTCPIAGRVVARRVNVGEMASPSAVLFTVANLSRVWAEADVYEKDLAKVRRGQIAEIRVDAYPDRVFTGRVDAIGDMLSAESRTAKVRCVVGNAEGLLKGEMFAKVSLVTARRGSTVLIPKQAILDETGAKIVFTPCMECPEDKASGTNACGAYDKFTVEVGSEHGSLVEILKGVEPGTHVVTVGRYQLKAALGSGKLEAGCSH